MKEQRKNIIRLGAFVIAGMVLLIIALFFIGKNQHFFGSNYILKTHFSNVGGLKAGNNVRYSGIVVGTVKKIVILNDTAIEVSLQIDKKMKTIIRNNALTSLGSDGLMGDKLINIIPQKGEKPFAVEGDLLPSRKPVEMDDVLRTLSVTNDNIKVISEELKVTVARINNSTGLWNLLSDEGIAKNIRKTTRNLEIATSNADVMTSDLREIISDVKSGKGPAGTILRDTVMVESLKNSVAQLEQVGLRANELATSLDNLTKNIDNEINQGSGSIHLLLKDTALTGNVSRTMVNVEKGTAAFNENMEALKHNWLFKGYFKKLEKEKAKQVKQ